MNLLKKGLFTMLLLMFIIWLYIFYTTKTNDLTCAGIMGTSCPALFSCKSEQPTFTDEQGTCVLFGVISIDSQKNYPTPIVLESTESSLIQTTATPILSSVQNSSRKNGWMKMISTDYYGNSFTIEYPESWDSYRNDNQFHIPCIEGDSDIENTCIYLVLGSGGNNESILNNSNTLTRNGFTLKYKSYNVGKRNFLKFSGSKGQFNIDGEVMDSERYPNIILTIAEMIETYTPRNN